MEKSRLSALGDKRSFGRVKYLVEAGAAEELPEKRKNGIAGMKIRPQVPAGSDRDGCRDVGQRKRQPTGPSRSTIAWPAIKCSQSDCRRKQPAQDERGILDPGGETCE